MDIGLESVLEEDGAAIVGNRPSQDDSEDVGSWTPDYEIPTVIVSAPLEVDSDDFAHLYSEDEEESERYLSSNCDDESDYQAGDEESEYESEDEPESPDDYPNASTLRVALSSSSRVQRN